MMAMPTFLKLYVTEAQKLITNGDVRDVEFSGATYQVKVFDPRSGQACWAFIQLDPQGLLQDAFCSCKEEEQLEGCPHLAAAMLRIYRDPLHPLHQRFERSLWNQLCRIFQERFGDRLKNVSRSKKTFSFGTHLRFTFSTVSAEKQFLELIETRPKETEETSLKFSNLPEEELALWREGKPGEDLKYELSFWSDLAKSMMIVQDDGGLKKVSFDYNTKGMPSEITVQLAKFSFTYKLQKGDLKRLVSSFGTVDAPLKVFNRLQDFVSSAIYDPKTGSMIFETKPFLKDPKSAIKLDDWTYIPKVGFYPHELHPLLKESSLPKQRLAEALNRYAYEIAPILKQSVIHLQPVKTNYTFRFDNVFNLHIIAYVTKPGDLSQPLSQLFGEWAYVDNVGFFRLYGLRFPHIATVIREHDVADFIRMEASWLNAFEGFKIHLQSLETQITYKVDQMGRLSFERRVSLADQKLRTKDFGPWIYVEGEGFYSKTHVPVTLPLQTGVTISPDQIPGFIHLNRAELELVAGFFCPSCPFVEVGLNVSLTETFAIDIVPFFQVKPEFLGHRLRFFDEIVYVEGEGFYELPLEMRLPERFREKRTFQGTELKNFLRQDLDKIQPFVASIDPRLKAPAMLYLVAENIAKSDHGYLLKLFYRTEKGQIPFSDLFQAYWQKQPFFFSNAGLIDLECERFEWFKAIKEGQVDFAKNTLWLSSVELIRLQAVEEVQCKGESAKILKELLDFKISDEPDLNGLTSVLRPYQEKGVHWLFSLFKFGLSGLLCDDMGLGKTHQAMGLFAAIRNVKSFQKPLFLVVCPTSVLYHWQEKLQEFMPGLKVLVYHGVKRRELLSKDYDLLLTSYGILRNETELFQELEFTLAVFDEIQIAKNHQSRLYGCLLQVRAVMRLGLSGTPIENRLRELKALVDIVLPLYMPSESDYSRLFVKPIERDHNMQQKQKLSKLINPFILRRKKGDVLLDLPDKTEEIAHCDLHPDQSRLYNEVLLHGREKLMPEIADSSKVIPYIHVFALLSHLKQILDHPALYLKQTADYKKYHWGKWELFLELLQEARESEQKVVVCTVSRHA